MLVGLASVPVRLVELDRRSLLTPYGADSRECEQVRGHAKDLGIHNQPMTWLNDECCFELCNKYESNISYRLIYYWLALFCLLRRYLYD